MAALEHLYGDVLSELPMPRRKHCAAVGNRLAAIAYLLPAADRADVLAAAALHDIGYAPSWVRTGFHPIDGAAGLRERGFAPLVVDLVATHTGATWEAAERKLPAHTFDAYLCDHPQIEALREMVTWADLTTSPLGERVSVQDRLSEIESRYKDSTHPVRRYIARHRAALVQVGSAKPRRIVGGPAQRPLYAHPLAAVHPQVKHGS